MSTYIPAGEATLASAAWRYRLLVLLAVLAFVAAGVVYAEARPPVYTASATMVVQDPHSNPVFAIPANPAPDRYTGDQIALLKSRQLAAAAALVDAERSPRLGFTADDFSSHLAVSGTALNGNLIQISFTAADGPTALAALDDIKTAYSRTVHAAVSAELSTVLGQIDTELAALNTDLARVTTQLAGTPPANQPALAQQEAALTARRDTLSSKRDQVVVDASSGNDGIALYLPAATTTHSSKLVTALPVLSVAAVLGLVAGLLAAYLLATRRPLFRRPNDAEFVLGAPLLAEIPKFGRFPELPAVDGKPKLAVSGFRSAALLIQARQPSAPGRIPSRRRTSTGPRRLVVVSAARREGRSSLTANLGVALTDSGQNTLLIDADPGTAGLAQLLHARLILDPAVDRVRVGLAAAGMSLENVVTPDDQRARLSLLRVGQTRRSIDASDREARLEELEAAFDVVIIDAPPLSDSGPYWPLVRRADGAVVVVTDRTTVNQVEEVSRLLSAIEMAAFGFLYNHAPRYHRASPAAEKTQPASPSARSNNLSESA